MRIAIAGLGRMGVRHAQVASDIGLQIIGVSDRRPEAITQAVTDCPSLAKASFFDNSAEMISALKPDLLVIATTAPSHCELTCRGAEAGVQYILCEKPLGVSIAECRLMIETCARHGARLAVNHQMRFMEQYTLIKSMAESDDFAGLSSVTAVAGNFGVAMNGSHYFEAFRFLTGLPATKVSASFSKAFVPNPRGREFFDRAGTVRLENSSGQRFYLDASADQGHGIHMTYACSLGRITVDELTGQVTFAHRKAEHREMPSTRYGMPWTDGERRIAPTSAIEPTRRVLESLLSNAGYPDGEVGLMTVRILVAAYLSDESGGRTVCLETELLPEDRVFPWA